MSEHKAVIPFGCIKMRRAGIQKRKYVSFVAFFSVFNIIYTFYMCKYRTLAPAVNWNKSVDRSFVSQALSGHFMWNPNAFWKMLFDEWIQWGRTPWHFIRNILINISPFRWYQIWNWLQWPNHFNMVESTFFFILLTIVFFYDV